MIRLDVHDLFEQRIDMLALLQYMSDFYRLETEEWIKLYGENLPIQGTTREMADVCRFVIERSGESPDRSRYVELVKEMRGG